MIDNRLVREEVMRQVKDMGDQFTVKALINILHITTVSLKLMKYLCTEFP